VAMSRFSSSKPMIPGGIEAANQGGEGVPPLFQIRESVFEHLSTDLNPTGQYEGTKKSRRRRQLLPQGRAEGTIVGHDSYLRTIRSMGQSLLLRLLGLLAGLGCAMYALHVLTC
jgi:hypothetical protein